MKDNHNREIDYMRISITDRCNFRCRYCMPEGCEKVEMSRILTYEQILKVCEAAAIVGIHKVKVTGGEPLVRKGCVEFIRRLNKIAGIDEVTLTSNGALLEENLPQLIDAGVRSVNMSLDSLNKNRFDSITGGGNLEKVLSALDASVASGVNVKINTVIQNGVNDDEILALCDMAFSKGVPIRFIELMPVGFGDRMRSYSNEIVKDKIKQVYKGLVLDGEKHGNGPAVYYKTADGSGRVGFISALNGVFCDSCNRIRLTSQGIDRKSVV